MSNHIEINIDGRRLPADKFRSVVTAFIDLIDSVSGEMAGDGNKAQWVIEVDKGSTIIKARSDADQNIAEYIQTGVKMLQSGTRQYPEFFNQRAILASKELGKIVDPDGANVSSLTLKNGSDPIEITSQTSATVDDLLGAKHEALGSVEGKIEVISDRNGFKCSIFDPLYNRSIVCHFDDEEKENQAVESFRGRVLARGVVRYDRAGTPVNILVNEIRQFAKETTLPSYRDVQEAYS